MVNVNDFAAGTAPPKVPSLGTAPIDHVHAGDVVAVTWSDIPPPNTGNWIALYAAGDSDRDFLAEKPVDTPPPPAANTTNFVMPTNLPPGAYELRIFTQKMGSRIAAGPAITVENPANTGGGSLQVQGGSSYQPSGVVHFHIQNNLAAPSSPGNTVALVCVENGLDVTTVHSVATYGQVDLTIPADLTPNLHYRFEYRRLNTAEVWAATRPWLYSTTVTPTSGIVRRVWDFLRANNSRQDVSFEMATARANSLIAIRPRFSPDVTTDAQYIPPGVSVGTLYFTIDGKYQVGTQYQAWLYDGEAQQSINYSIPFSIIS